jgi:hypothetical protein
MDHDQRFKTLIQTFFAEFLQLFFAEWANRLDFGRVEWLDKEVFHDPPEGQRRALDLVGKLPTRQAVPGQRSGEPEQWLALVHIEIESPDKAAPVRPRMLDAYVHLRRHHGLPVLPIALFLRVGLDGIGIDNYEEHFWNLRPIQFQYLYVGLPALDAIKYVQGDNWLGVALAALMRIPPDKAAWLGAEALRRIAGAPLSDQQRFLLAECVEAYLPLDDAQKREFKRLATTETYQGVQAMNKTSYEQGLEKGLEIGKATFEKAMEKGIEKGIEQAQRAMVREALEERFGPLPPEVQRRLDELPAERLRPLCKAAWKAQSLAELGLDT